MKVTAPSGKAKEVKQGIRNALHSDVWVNRNNDGKRQRVSLLSALCGDDYSRVIVHVVGYGHIDGQWGISGDSVSSIHAAMHKALMKCMGPLVFQQKLRARDVLMLLSFAWSDESLMWDNQDPNLKAGARDVSDLLQAYPIVTYSGDILTQTQGYLADLGSVSFLVENAQDAWDVHAWMKSVAGFNMQGGALRIRWYDLSVDHTAVAAAGSSDAGEGDGSGGATGQMVVHHHHQQQQQGLTVEKFVEDMVKQMRKPSIEEE